MLRATRSVRRLSLPPYLRPRICRVQVRICVSVCVCMSQTLCFLHALPPVQTLTRSQRLSLPLSLSSLTILLCFSPTFNCDAARVYLIFRGNLFLSLNLSEVIDSWKSTVCSECYVLFIDKI